MAGLLRAIGEGDLQEMEAEESAEYERAEQSLALSDLAGYVRERFYEFKRHRTERNISNRLVECLRAYKGEYSPSKLAEIRTFSGSEVFARLTAVKCRSATALLRDVFVGAERPWGVSPTPVPTLPTDVLSSINTLLESEVQTLIATGQPIDDRMIEQRRSQLISSSYRAAYKQAQEHADYVEQKVQDVLIEGGFYDALIEFLIDLPIYPFACIKGPVIQNVEELRWIEGVAETITVPKMFWRRVDPNDVYFTPGASSVEEASVIERIRLSRADLNALIGVPGYDEDAIRNVLVDYARGLYDNLDDNDTEVAELQDKENPNLNRSELIDGLEWTGPVQGQMLLDYGFDEGEITDAELDYFVKAWVIGKYVIKVQINPNPNKRHEYFSSSFEKVPGSIYGYGLPEIIEDSQSVANAALRSLVNNMAISSGPQVVVNEDMVSPVSDPDSLYPWKRWRFNSDPMNNGMKPVDFFQPQSNAQELLGVYKAMTDIADETSAIPRYITGNDRTGGAARTASGLSMLMNNASKVLQNVAASIDRDVMEPLIKHLFNMLVLTDLEGVYRGDEQIAVRGVTVAAQKETDRMRRLEFLQLTANPIDMEIVGLEGRAGVLRTIAEDLGLPGDSIVPDDQQLQAKQQQMQQMQAQAAAQEQAKLMLKKGTENMPAPGHPGAGLGEETDSMFRTNV